MKKIIQLLILTLLVLTVTGCAKGMLAGEYSESPALDSDKNAIKTDRMFGGQKTEKKITRKARSVVISENAREAVKKTAEQAQTPICPSIDLNLVSKLSAAGQVEAMRSGFMCSMFAVAERMVAYSNNAPVTAVGEVAKYFGEYIDASEKGLTDRSVGIVAKFTDALKIKFVADVGSDIAKNAGNRTTVGNIQQTQSDSRDSLAGGEAGGATAASTLGQNLVIGGTGVNGFNDAQIAENLVSPEGSSNGSINTGRTQGSPTAEEVNAAAEVDDSDGVKF